MQTDTLEKKLFLLEVSFSGTRLWQTPGLGGGAAHPRGVTGQLPVSSVRGCPAQQAPQALL